MEIHPDVARAIRQESRGAPRVVRKAAYAATLVETGGRNLSYGDRDSLGAFQQRPSQGWGKPAQLMNPRYAARQFIKRAKIVARQHPEYDSAQIAQAVQRSAFPDRYGARDVQATAQRLSAGGGGGAATFTGLTTTDVSLGRRTIPGQSFAPERQAATEQLLSGGKLTISKLLDYKRTLNSLQDVPSRTVAGDLKVTHHQGSAITVQGSQGPKAPSSLASRLMRRAEALDAQHLPYKWGGGHGSRVNVHRAAPLDCSGAVSAVLGIDPRVSGDFARWGKPGEGGSTTIYANAHHVLMKIRDPKTGSWHFFGTSQSNPGGGAGWIPQHAISPEYLKGFIARHV